MVLARRRVTCVAAGLWFACGLTRCRGLSAPPCSVRHECYSFQAGSSSRAHGVEHRAYTSFRMRPRTKREGSTVDMDSVSSLVKPLSSQTQLIEPRSLEAAGGTVLLDTRHEASSPLALEVTEGDVDRGNLGFAAAAAGSVEGRRGGRKGRGPELLEGDRLENTPKMVFLTYFSLGLNVLYLLQAASTISSSWQAFWMAAAALAGVLIADLVSGVFHWSVDNYGDRNTPVFGAVIEAFQGHHASPWTITHRPFENNVHKIAYAVLPLLALLRWSNPGPIGVALGVTFLVGSLMSQECHRYAHMTQPPGPVRFLQDLGVMVGRRHHGQHHSSPFEEKYCIVNGVCNGPLDFFRVFRFLERVIYQVNGVEPIAWRLDAAVKEEALSTGWLPFPDRAAPK